MANDPEKAAYYEGKIDDFFEATPRLKASFATQGLDYQPCGVVVHEDGSVTYIGGCGDSPERVAEVNAINKAQREHKSLYKMAGGLRQRRECLVGEVRRYIYLQRSGRLSDVPHISRIRKEYMGCGTTAKKNPLGILFCCIQRRKSGNSLL